jgi:hypothetical protein
MTDLFFRVILVGLSAAGLVVFLRALPLVQRLVREQKKPWACDVCMSFWSTFLLTSATFHFDGGLALAAAAPGFAVALLVLRKLTEPLRLPPNLPELTEEE